jgi:hypothetical protein
VLPTLVLLHSPLTTSAVWGDLPGLLRSSGHDVVVPDVTDDEQPPYATRYVAAVARHLLGSIGRGPSLLVGHGGAGPLLPQIGFARHALSAPVAGYIFLDAMLPRVPRAATRLALMHLEDEAFAHGLDEHLRAGGRFPQWNDEQLVDEIPDPELRTVVVGSQRPRALDWFTEPLPQPEDWPDAPVGYVQLSAACSQPSATARHRGWSVVVRETHHFAALTDPGLVAAALDEAVASL